MSVLTGITDTVRAVAAGSAQRAVKSAADGIKSIAGLNPEGSNSERRLSFHQLGSLLIF